MSTQAAVVIDLWVAIVVVGTCWGAIGVAGFLAYRAGERRDREINLLRERTHALSNAAAKLEGRMESLEDRSGPYEGPPAMQTWRLPSPTANPRDKT